MGRTEDWSEFVQAPVDAEIVELAGKWKHGWIPLDATAVSSKMKGKTGGKKWWGGGRAKPSGQVVGKKRRSQELQSRQTDRDRLQRNQNQVAGFKRDGKATGVLNVGQVPSAKTQKRNKAPAAEASKVPYQDGKIGGMDAKPTAADASWAATRTDSQLKKAYVPPSGREGQRELQQNNAVAAELRKRGIKVPTAGGKPVDVTQKRLTGSGQAVRTLGSDADRLAANYVKMHGTDGARRKLAALKKVKTKDARKSELIAALERKIER